MKREDLKKLELSDEVIDGIMKLHGTDIEKHKADLAAADANAKAFQKQIEEANKQIESFKGLDIEGVKKQADDWKAKAEQAQKEAAESISRLKFEHALDGALSTAKAKNPKAVKALLNQADLKLAEDGSIVGLKEQLEKVKAENDYLFISDNPPPEIVTGSQNQSQGLDAFEAALLKGAGIQTAQGK